MILFSPLAFTNRNRYLCIDDINSATLSESKEENCLFFSQERPLSDQNPLVVKKTIPGVFVEYARFGEKTLSHF